jgi:peptidyl-prolyl cis-trans isomerase B (cyclophilin B)
MAAVVWFTIAVARHLDDESRYYPDITAAPTTPGGGLPDFDPPPNVGANCAYPSTTEPASKPNKPPRTGRVPTDPAEVSASMSTNAGDIGIQLDNNKAPCTVNSFASLAQQGYFDGTTCHRLTTTPQPVCCSAATRPERERVGRVTDSPTSTPPTSTGSPILR